MNWFLRLITAKNVIAIALAPFGIYVRDNKTLNNMYIIRHEKIHVRQQYELLIVFFYLWYVIEWMVRGFDYDNISFEREANANMYDNTYLYIRKHYNWIKYLTKTKKDEVTS